MKLSAWLISAIEAYQRRGGSKAFFGIECNFQPTCSEYCIESLKQWGLFKGLYFSVKRISKCHPWGGEGYDPVPKKD